MSTTSPNATGELSREHTLAHCTNLASRQLGGTLATTHAEDGTPYVTYVLFHLRDDGSVIFGTAPGPQHTRNMLATPEVSFLVDNREVIEQDWTAFDRVVIEGSSSQIAKEDRRYSPLLEELRAKNGMAAHFTETGRLFYIQPRRLILMRGLDPTRNIVDFEHGD